VDPWAFFVSYSYFSFGSGLSFGESPVISVLMLISVSQLACSVMSPVFSRSLMNLNACSMLVSPYSADTALTMSCRVRLPLMKLRISNRFKANLVSFSLVSSYHLYCSSPMSCLKVSMSRVHLSCRVGTMVLACFSASVSSSSIGNVMPSDLLMSSTVSWILWIAWLPVSSMCLANFSIRVSRSGFVASFLTECSACFSRCVMCSILFLW